jgi:hypothetical protein
MDCIKVNPMKERVPGGPRSRRAVRVLWGQPGSSSWRLHGAARDRAMQSARRLAAAVPIAWLFVTATGRLEADGYRFVIPTIEARPCDDVRLTVQGDHEKSAQGFSLAARYPSDQLEIHRIHMDGTILEAIHVDYFETIVSPEDGILVVGVLVDSQPPFDGVLIPSIGEPLDLLYIEATVLETAKEDLKIRLEDGLSTPPVNNLYSIDNQSVRVTELGEGVIRLFSSGPAFVRGDFNMDRRRDISDAMAILIHTFRGRGSVRCLAAGDVNDDEAVDISPLHHRRTASSSPFARRTGPHARRA